MALSNYFLRAESEQDLWDSLESLGLARKVYDPTDPLNVPPPALPFEDEMETDGEIEVWEGPTGAFEYQFTGIALDIIGTIYDKEENPIPGFHANIIAESSEGLPIVDPQPKTPYRVWA